MQVLAGNSLQAVGEQMGVTRERIRQYLMDAGLRTKEARGSVQHCDATHVWAWERFRTWEPGRRGLRARRLRRRERVARWVVWLRDFAESNGRSPTYTEFARAVFGECTTSASAPRLIPHFAVHSITNRPRAIRILHALYRQAGIVPVKPGGGTPNFANLSRARKAWWAALSDEQRASQVRKRVRGLKRANRERAKANRR
jgi:hypothetical protein